VKLVWSRIIGKVHGVATRAGDKGIDCSQRAIEEIPDKKRPIERCSDRRNPPEGGGQNKLHKVGKEEVGVNYLLRLPCEVPLEERKCHPSRNIHYSFKEEGYKLKRIVV